MPYTKDDLLKGQEIITNGLKMKKRQVITALAEKPLSKETLQSLFNGYINLLTRLELVNDMLDDWDK